MWRRTRSSAVRSGVLPSTSDRHAHFSQQSQYAVGLVRFNLHITSRLVVDLLRLAPPSGNSLAVVSFVADHRAFSAAAEGLSEATRQTFKDILTQIKIE